MNVFEFVENKFKGIVDKAGNSYIYHLYSVSNYVLLSVSVLSEKFMKCKYAALLHDIFEDTDTSEDEVRTLDGVDDEVIEAVKCLTRSKDETYMEYIERVSKNPIAKVVKLADLKDNMDITRYESFDDVSISLLERYHKAYKYLIDK